MNLAGACLRPMEIGSNIRWGGRVYVLVGVDPTNVPDRRAYLLDPADGETIEVLFDEVEPLEDGPGDVSQTQR
jgi:hypothetical protein